METSAQKILIIGLDGATLDYIMPQVEKGNLPAFKKIIEDGVVGELQTVFPPLTAPAWSSFLTGKNPGKHGVFDFFSRQPGSFNISPVNANVLRHKTIWEILSQANTNVISINVPLTYPPYQVKGFMVSGLLTPRTSKNFTYYVWQGLG